MKYYPYFCLLISTLIFASRHKYFEPPEIAGYQAPDMNVSFFYNYIDHFNHNNKAKYAQKYATIQTYWDHNNYFGFLYLCGESACNFSKNAGTFPSQYAQQKSVFFAMLEHRYYGESQPASNWSLANLKYLNHDQALGDAAYFLENLNKNISLNYSVPPLKWVVFGGSYAGALSAWLRYKYPHLVVGSISSSGVVHPFVNFYQYEMQIKKDLQLHDQDCYKRLQQYESYAEDNINDPTKRNTFMGYFNATFLTIPNFYVYFSDIYVGYIQYSKRHSMCQKLMNISDSLPLATQMAAYGEIGLENGVDPKDYTMGGVQNISIDFHHSDRQWLYQYCTAYGWFQIADIDQPLRWIGINVSYYLDYCEQAFGYRFYPSADHINKLYGAENIENTSSNIVFTQGSDDPWQWAGVHSYPIKPLLVDLCINNCDDCGHCRDLHAESPDDPDGIKFCREIEKRRISDWIFEPNKRSTKY